MRRQDSQHARELRQQRYSVLEIAQTIGASKTSVSKWVRDIIVPPELIDRIQSRVRQAHRRTGQTLQQKRLDRWEEYRQQATIEFENYRNNPLFMLGLGIYMGEGAKTGTTVQITNSDPAILRLSIRFLELVGCPTSLLRVSGVIHTDVDSQVALNY